MEQAMGAKRSSLPANLSLSLPGRVPGPFSVSYSAAKFAVEGFFTSLRTELRLRNIDLPITVAVLGYIDTGE